MRPRPTAAVLLGALTLLLAACSSPSADPAADLRRQAASIDAAAQEVLTALQSAGFTEASARGIVDACQSEPAPGVAYRVGVTAKIGDAPEDAFETLLGELDANGWQQKGEDAGAADMPARFTRDDLMLDIKSGGFTVGDTAYGADELALGITHVDGCVRVPDGGYISKVRDLEKQITPAG